MEKLETKRCFACGYENELQDHHIIPTSILENSEEINSEEVITLCERHHNIIHKFLNKWIWINRNKSEKDIFLEIKEKTLWFCKLEWGKWSKKDRKFFYNHCILCRNPATFVWYDFDKKIGKIGLCKNCADWKEREYQKCLNKKDEVII